MRRFFFATVFMILAVGVGWRYAPQDARQRLLAFIGVANRVRPSGIAQEIKDKIMPEDPVARRAALTAALRQKIAEIQEGAGVEKSADRGGAPAGAPVLAGTPDTHAASVGKSADDAAQLVNQLEQANHDASVGGQVVQRVLNAILPAAQCQAP